VAKNRDMKALSTLSKPRLVFFNLLLVLLLGVIDTLTGQEISFSVFYMLPIYLVTWYCGRWPGVAISVLCSLVWLAADDISGAATSFSLIPVWNMVVRLIFFLMMTYLLSELQKNEQRRRMLERVFFHDILNLVGSVRGFAELLKNNDVQATQEIYDLIYQAADRSLEDIEAQRALASAEKNELVIERTEVSSRVLMNLITNLYQHHKVAKGRTIVIADETENFQFVSDQSILSRILGNMLKNGLEGTKDGGRVVFGCRQEREQICFWVHNDAVIPDQPRRQIFKQGISTKGKGRGIGTYSMKLLTEYLHGEISFRSNEQEGTTFKACFPMITSEGNELL